MGSLDYGESTKNPEARIEERLPKLCEGLWFGRLMVWFKASGGRASQLLKGLGSRAWHLGFRGYRLHKT